MAAGGGNFTCADPLFTECMPQLSSLFPTTSVFDCGVSTEMFGEYGTSDGTTHSADSIETIARSLSRNIDSSEVIHSTRLRHNSSLSVLGLEDDSIFSSGIAADDMCSLLEQFEQASDSIPEFPVDLHFPKSVSEPPSRVGSPDRQASELEVVKLLRSTSPLKIYPSHGTTCSSLPVSPVSRAQRPATASAKQARQSTSRLDHLPTAAAPEHIIVNAGYYRDIQDHNYCSNVHVSSSRTTLDSVNPADAVEMNPEGSVLKSMLISSEMMAKMKEETFKRRSSSGSSVNSARSAPDETASLLGSDVSSALNDNVMTDCVVDNVLHDISEEIESTAEQTAQTRVSEQSGNLLCQSGTKKDKKECQKKMEKSEVTKDRKSVKITKKTQDMAKKSKRTHDKVVAKDNQETEKRMKTAHLKPVPDVRKNGQVSRQNSTEIPQQPRVSNAKRVVPKEALRSGVQKEVQKSVVHKEDVKDVVQKEAVKTVVKKEVWKSVLRKEEGKTVVPKVAVKSTVQKEKMKNEQKKEILAQKRADKQELELPPPVGRMNSVPKSPVVPSKSDTNPVQGNSENPNNMVSIVTVTKKPPVVVAAAASNTQKKTFTLDELIATDMKRKAIEKAQLEAILKTTPRSTPKSSPSQSPGKSESPKLPELPQISLKQLSNKLGSKDIETGPSPQASPAKKKLFEKPVVSKSQGHKNWVPPDKEEMIKVLEGKREVPKPDKRMIPPEFAQTSRGKEHGLKPATKMAENDPSRSSRPFPDFMKNDEKQAMKTTVPLPDVSRAPVAGPSRIRTESKCLDVVDMDVDENKNDEKPGVSLTCSDAAASAKLEETIAKAAEIMKEHLAADLAVVDKNARTEPPNGKTVTAEDKPAPIANFTACDKMEVELSPANQVRADVDDTREAAVKSEPSPSEKLNTKAEENAEADVDVHVADTSAPAAMDMDEDPDGDLYDEAMDFHVPPGEDFPDDDGMRDDNFQFDPITDQYHNEASTTDTLPNSRPACVNKFPLIKDPLGLESGEFPVVPEGNIDHVDDNEEPVKAEICDAARKKVKKNSNRNYRKRSSVSPEREPVVFDKLPGYCKILTSQTVNKYPQKSDSIRAAAAHPDGSVPHLERDPTPERNVDPMYNKVPQYVTHFTNSTRYDGEAGVAGSAHSSRSQTPSLVISASRNVSRESTPPKAYQERARSLSSSSSCSSSSSSSDSSDCRSQRSRSGHRSSSRSRSRRPGGAGRRNGRLGPYSPRSRDASRRSSHRSRSRSPISRRRHRRSSRSTSRSSSRSRSRSRSRRRDRRRRGERVAHAQRRPLHAARRSPSPDERRWRGDVDPRDKRKQKQIEERRIVYVGRISPSFTRRDLRIQFEQFGQVEETSVHLRESGGDHYGFVTFVYTCDAFAAIEKGNKCRGLEKYDLCFGGRRQFCRESYADLDGNAEEEEEMAPVMPKRGVGGGGGGGGLDFDALLRQTQKLIQKKKKSSS